MGTEFASVYNRFLGKITDDMYMELTPEDTIRDVQNLLIDSIPGFEFPRVTLDYEIKMRAIDKDSYNKSGFIITDIDGNGYEDSSAFVNSLTSEEINILAILMMNGWLQRQITSIENIRMKYGGTDFKMTSQAAHLGKLLSLLEECQRQSIHMQRLYKRRKIDDNGQIKSNWSVFGKGTGAAASGGREEVKEVIYDGGVL
jgi:hypothetical protein